MSFFIGLDLGRLNDYSALAIAERIEQPVKLAADRIWEPGHALYSLAHHIVDKPQEPPPAPKASYHLRYLQRYPLRTPYPSIVAQVKALVSRPELDEAVLAIDSTGVGIAIHNLLEDADLPFPLYGIVIHGGDTVTEDDKGYRVPKRDLITLTQVLLQNERLKIAKELKDASTLTKELLDYRLKIDPTTAHDSYNARGGKHDDLVLAVALACWAGENIGGIMPRVRRLRRF